MYVGVLPGIAGVGLTGGGGGQIVPGVEKEGIEIPAELSVHIQKALKVIDHFCHRGSANCCFLCKKQVNFKKQQLVLFFPLAIQMNIKILAICCEKCSRF